MLQALEAIKALYEADKSAVLAVIQSSEGGVEAFILARLQDAGNNLTGFAKILYGFVEPQLAAYVQKEVAQYGPTVVYAYIDTFLAEEIKRYGG